MKTTAILSLLLLTAIASRAGTPPAVPLSPAPDESGWRYSAGAYLWTQGLEGATGVGGVTADVDVPFSDIFDVLDFSFMGVFEAKRDRWSLLTDINYTELSPSATTRDILFSGADMKMKQLMANVALNYQVVATEQTSVTLYAGTRINGLDVSLSLNGVNGGHVSKSGDDYWYDAIVGVRLRQHLSGPWFLRLTGDIGAGDSDSTWQALGLIEYQLKDNLSLGLGYRWLDTDYQNSGFIYDVQASGLVFGAEMRF